MRSSFFEFTVATSGLFAARGGLDTVSHNVSNAATKGYSRQYIEQRADYPMTLFNGKGMYGTGAEIYGVNQYRNTFLDKKYWSETAVLGEYSAKKTHLTVIESIMSEMKSTGLSAQFNDFFGKLEDLTTNAGDSTYRTNVIQLGNSMTTFIKNTYESFREQQKDANEEIKTSVDMINSYAQQIRALNDQIARYEMDGSKANDMRDQRAVLVDELSLIVNVEVKETERNDEYASGKFPNPEDRNKSIKEFSVQINGMDLVKGVNVNLLECRERKAEITAGGTKVGTRSNIEDAEGLYDVYWKNSNQEFDLYHPNLKGELKGLAEIRDGNNGSFFKYTGLSSNAYTVSGTQLTFNIANSQNYRLDLSPSGGKLKMVDNNGTIREYDYKSYNSVVDPNTKIATITIDFVGNPAPTAAELANNQSISIGETTTYKGIPYYMSRLNDLVRTFATAINEGKYMDGKDIPGVTGHINGFNANNENLGTYFFTYKGYVTGDPFDINNLTADNFITNPDFEKHPDLLAASSGNGISDNNIILDFLKIKNDKSLFLEGNITSYIIGIAGELGIDLEQATNFEKNYTDVTKTVDNQRMSVSGVDINEEMILMIKYQTQYSACAKLINILDGIYDTTINRMGV